MDKQQKGRLILEASTGVHGEVAAMLAREWVKLAEQLETREQYRAAQAAPTLLDALKSGKAILIDWPMEPSTPEEALKLMDAMDAEYAKTMGKPAPDDEMAVAMRRVRHMACDLWAWQKEAMRSHFVELAAAQPSQATYSGWVWEHIKSGGEYELLGDAKVQCDVPLTDMAKVYVYQGEDCSMWVRPVAEFHARFKRSRPHGRPITAGPTPAPPPPAAA